MSIRTHAPDCAKTRALIESEEGSTECCLVECTCGATYRAGVERQRDQARDEAEIMRDWHSPNHVFGWEDGA